MGKNIVQEIMDGNVRGDNQLPESECDKSLAKEFNDYFIFIGKSIINSPVIDNDSDNDRTTPSQTLSHFAEISIKETGDIINALKGTATGPDEISSEVLKISFEKQGSVVRDQVNISLKSGTFPDKLKLAKIIPIFKKGDKMH